MGTILIGDSAGAHFSIPPEWVNVSDWTTGTFKDFIPRATNELDLPHKSAGTGFVKEKWV